MEETPPRRRSSAFRTFVLIVYGFLAFVGALTIVVLWVAWEYSYDEFLFVPTGHKNDELVATLDTELTERTCNVLGVELRGAITTYLPEHADYIVEETLDAVSSEDIVAMIEYAESTDQIQATLIEVDSYGGLPVASEEIANAIKRAEKPVVAYIRSAGVSAGYWAISPADTIIASEVSDVGSIGVTMSYVETAGENEEAGKVYREISSGTFKNTGDPEKVLTEAERELLLRDVYLANDVFIRTVAENRGLTIDAVRSIADGSSVLGARALELGLIDAIGDQRVALQSLENTIGAPAEVCW